jgi:hypothetical protein
MVDRSRVIETGEANRRCPGQILMILVDTDHLSVLTDPRQALRARLLDRLQASEDDVAIPVMPAEASGRIGCRMTSCIQHGRASWSGAARRQPTAGLGEPVWIDVATH